GLVLLLTVAIIVIITALSGRSAALALKLQIPIMIAVGLSLVALLLGVFTKDLKMPEWEATYRTAPAGFWYVFAVFFPAVTGFTAGIGMSGDLRDPSRSIPRGTLWAVITGAAAYILVPVLLSVSNAVSVEELASPGMGVWISVALFGPWLIFAGMWGAILSSAFGSVLSGPRVLQALSKDGLAPKFLSRLSAKGQPTVSTWLTGALALAAVALGNLNAVAQFVTVLFLMLYVIINFSAAMENLVGDPSYRPKINVPWYISMLGALGALFVMFLLNPLACVAASLIQLCIFLYLRKKTLRQRWGDVRAGMWFSIARFALLKLKKYGAVSRNWRPHIISFTEDISREVDLVYIASCLNQKHGIVTACKIIEGDLEGMAPEVDRLEKEMNRVLDEQDLIAFCEVNVAPDFLTGVINITQANGIAGIHSNTVMFGWPEKREKLISLLRLMRIISEIEKNTMIMRLAPIRRNVTKQRIDLWWGGLEYNGDLMLLLAHLLRMNPEWEKARIVIRSVVLSEEEKEGMEKSISQLINSARIEADADIIVKTPHRMLNEIIKTTSSDADIVFVGLMVPEEGEESLYADRLIKLTEGLESIVFVRNACEFSGKLI
ncbi:MAG: amino acid permease, partial [Candidatus Krumholzibacteriota bacterium]|nr:amino acid permease [Candidatus Krumholzibacteriota bacterium]